MALDLSKLRVAINTMARAVRNPELMPLATKLIQQSMDSNESAALNYVKQHLYPPPRSGKGKFRFGSEKSRRWFWKQVALGNIQVPYKRTMTLQEATTARPLVITERGFTLAVEVDTDKAPYAKWVVGTEQIGGHTDTGWPKLLVDDHAADLFSREAADAVNEALFGLIEEGLPRD